MLYEVITMSREGLLGNRYILPAVGLLLLFQLAFTYLPVMQHLFGTASLEIASWLRVVLVASTVFLLVELEKAIFVITSYSIHYTKLYEICLVFPILPP